MNLRSLRYFLKVAEYGSITRSASELHITQPSLTQHLKQLEEHFGLALFMRHGRGIVLTEAGKVLRLRGGVLLEQIDGLQDELESSEALPRGVLAVGMPISWSELVTYPVIERYRKQFPDVRIKLVVNSSEILASAMNNNEVQIAILTEVDDLTNFHFTPTVVDELFLVGPAEARLDERSVITLKELVDYPMILPLNSTLVLRRTHEALTAMGLSLKVVMETASSNIVPLIARGAGYTALSAAALPQLGPDSAFSATQVRGLPITWAVATPRNRPTTAAVAAFKKLLLEQVTACVTAGRWRTARLLGADE